MSAQTDGESAAELRLRSLISEMEKFDSLEEDDAPEPLGDDELGVPHWHWSDDSSDPD